MKLYRIYCGLACQGCTKKKTIKFSEEAAMALADAHLGDYTVYEAAGRWKGGFEPTLVFEYMTTDYEEGDLKVARFASLYKEGNLQESVLVITTTPENYFF